LLVPAAAETFLDAAASISQKMSVGTYRIDPQNPDLVALRRAVLAIFLEAVASLDRRAYHLEVRGNDQ